MDYFPIPIVQYVLGGSLHKNNVTYLLLGLYRASVNRISIVLMQITPQKEQYFGIFGHSRASKILFNNSPYKLNNKKKNPLLN